MKYARTYDGKVFEKITFTINNEKKISGIGLLTLYGPSDIIKEADKIEDLCDRFVYSCGTDKKFYTTLSHQEFEESIENDQFDNLFGAIWYEVDGKPVLKSVAKVNEKGELCLI